MIKFLVLSESCKFKLILHHALGENVPHLKVLLLSDGN